MGGGSGPFLGDGDNGLTDDPLNRYRGPFKLFVVVMLVVVRILIFVVAQPPENFPA